MPKNTPFSHCHYCGEKYRKQPEPPYKCSKCKATVWRNPLPVAIVAVPVVMADGEDPFAYVGVVRNIEPGKGKEAFPGGYIDWNEKSIAAAGRREVKQETGLTVKNLKIEGTELINNFVCFMMKCDPVKYSRINFDFSNEETQKLVLLDHTSLNKMAFSIQRKFLRKLTRK